MTIREFYAEEVVAYVGGTSSLEWATDEAREIVHAASIRWDAVECDPEGPDQEAELDAVVDEAVQELMDLDEACVNRFRFDYLHKSGDYTEYDGYVANSPSEEFAWQEFLGYAGPYGIANAGDYTCVAL